MLPPTETRDALNAMMLERKVPHGRLLGRRRGPWIVFLRRVPSSACVPGCTLGHLVNDGLLIERFVIDEGRAFLRQEDAVSSGMMSEMPRKKRRNATGTSVSATERETGTIGDRCHDFC